MNNLLQFLKLDLKLASRLLDKLLYSFVLAVFLFMKIIIYLFIFMSLHFIEKHLETLKSKFGHHSLPS